MHCHFAGVVQKTTAAQLHMVPLTPNTSVRIRSSIGAGTSSTRVAELGLNVVVKEISVYVLDLNVVVKEH